MIDEWEQGSIYFSLSQRRSGAKEAERNRVQKRHTRLKA